MKVQVVFTFAEGLLADPDLVDAAASGGLADERVAVATLVGHDRVVGHGGELGLAVVRIGRHRTLHGCNEIALLCGALSHRQKGPRITDGVFKMAAPRTTGRPA